MIPIRLEWSRFQNGVELIGSEGEEETDEPHPGYFRARSDVTVPVSYEVNDLENPVALHFVNAFWQDAIRENDGRRLAAFLTRFGMTSKGRDIAHKEIHELGVIMLLSLEHGTNLLDLSGLNQTHIDDYRGRLELRGESISENELKTAYLNVFLKNANLHPTIALDSPDGVPRIVLEPESLVDLMVMEIALAVEAGAKGRYCHHCLRIYLVGALTGRRSHSVYCSDKCRVAAMRKRNSVQKE